MFDIFQYDIIRNAIFIAMFLAVSAALLSPFLVLNEQALIGDGLAHISFTGLVIGIVLIDQPYFIVIPFVVLSSVIIKYLTSKQKINGDAALGIISAIVMAVGLIIISVSNGFNRSIESMLVGSLFTVTNIEIIISLIIFLLIFLFIIIFYRKLLITVYDESFAKTKNIKTTLLNYSVSILTAIFISIGVRTIGMLLISSLIIFPSIISSQIFKSFKFNLIFGLLLSILVVLVGIISAHYLNIPASPTIICIYGIFLVLSLVLKKVRSRL